MVFSQSQFDSQNALSSSWKGGSQRARISVEQSNRLSICMQVIISLVSLGNQASAAAQIETSLLVVADFFLNFLMF